MVSSILTLHFSSSMLQKPQDTLDQIHLNCLQRGHIWTHWPKTCLSSEGTTPTFDLQKKIITEGHFKLWKAWVRFSRHKSHQREHFVARNPNLVFVQVSHVCWMVSQNFFPIDFGTIICTLAWHKARPCLPIYISVWRHTKVVACTSSPFRQRHKRQKDSLGWLSTNNYKSLLVTSVITLFCLQ